MKGAVSLLLAVAAIGLWIFAMMSWDDPPRHPKDGRYVAACVGAGLLLVAAVAATPLLLEVERRRILARSAPLRGWIVQANMALWEEGPHDAPAQLLVSFPGDREAPDGPLRALADRLAELKTRPPADDVERSVAGLVTDETYRPGDRVLLPLAFTGGLEVHSVHVWILRRLLPRGKLTIPFVRCMAIPGSSGEVLMVSYHPAELPRAGPPA